MKIQVIGFGLLYHHIIRISIRLRIVSQSFKYIPFSVNPTIVSFALGERNEMCIRGLRGTLAAPASA